MDAAEGEAGQPETAGQAASVHVRNSRGVVVGDGAHVVNVFHGPGRVAGTAYLEQVRDIAPAELLHREEELGELAEFCTGPGPGGPGGDASYLWWQAGPWAGKSALMSWFVLHPPPGTDVVCFFVTARLAGQADSTAFTEALLEQLASLAGEELPASPASANRDAHRRLLLRTAARQAREAQRRLVLVIDGLDEDRSGHSAEGLPSIASLLPRHPEEGLRVIVSGRPHPDIPGDVVGDHPLRRCAVRRLAVYPQASDIERRAKDELRKLLRGPEDGKHLLGLVTAAQGGLTLDDLESLTRLAPHQIEDVLSSASGRTFIRRAADYLLAHETLQDEATHSLGRSLDHYRQQIHDWAGDYRARRWPPDTPAYLLRGYPQMLRALGDTTRVAGLALDAERHDRMLASLGGDGAAVAEITAAFEMTAATASPDFAPLLSLAARRDDLLARNANVPPVLPLAWATLGYPVRAEALARAIGDPTGRASALTRLTTLLAEAGEHEHVRRLAPDAIAAVRSAGDLDVQGQFLLRVVRATASAGDLALAATAARAIEDPFWKADAATLLARAHGEADRPDEGTVDDDQNYAERTVAPAVSSAQPDGGAAGRAVPEIGLVPFAYALARSGRTREAALIAGSIDDPLLRAEALTEVAEGIAIHGAPHDAIGLIQRDIAQPGWQARALGKIAVLLAARRMIGTLPRESANSAALMEAPWTAVVRELPEPEYIAHAVADARAIAGSAGRAEALADVAWALALAGRPAEAVPVLNEAEAVARDLSPASQLTAGLPDLVDALCLAGKPVEARAVAVAISSESARLRAYGLVLRALLDAGLYQDALTMVPLMPKSSAPGEAAVDLARAGQHKPATEIALAIPNRGFREATLIDVARALASRGDGAGAIATAHLISDLSGRVHSFTKLATLLAGPRQNEHASQAATAAIAAAVTITDATTRADSLAKMAGLFAEARLGEHASQAATAAVSAAEQSAYLPTASHVLMALISAGAHEQTTSMARIIEKWEARDVAVCESARAMVSGDYERAIAIASSMPAGEGQEPLIFAIIRRLAVVDDLPRLKMAITASIDISRKEAEAKHFLLYPDDYLSELARSICGDRYEEVLRWANTDPGRSEQARLLADATEELAAAENATIVIINPGPASPGFANTGDHLLVPFISAESRAQRRAEADRRARREAMDALSAAGSDGMSDYEVARAIHTLLRLTERQEVIAVARAISRPRHRVTALTTIAEVLVDAAGDTVTARQLTIEALAVGPWTVPLRLVALLAPDALSAFATECLATVGPLAFPGPSAILEHGTGG